MTELQHLLVPMAPALAPEFLETCTASGAFALSVLALAVTVRLALAPLLALPVAEMTHAKSVIDATSVSVSVCVRQLPCRLESVNQGT